MLQVRGADGGYSDRLCSRGEKVHRLRLRHIVGGSYVHWITAAVATQDPPKNTVVSVRALEKCRSRLFAEASDLSMAVIARVASRSY